MSVDELNQMRKSLKVKTILLIWVPMAVALLCFGLLDQPVIGVIAVITTIVSTLLLRRSRAMFDKEFKDMFVLSTFEEVFDNVNYQPFDGLDRSIIRDTKMMYMGNRYSSNDYLEATYKGIPFKQADVHIEEETRDRDGHSRYVTLFKGRWMIFDFNKTFKANVQVVEKGFHNAKRTTIFGKEGEKYQKVEMEDVAFNKEFKVFAQNAHDAFYILTPAMMDRIRQVTGSSRGRIMFCFIDNALHVAIYDNKDSFEANIMKDIDFNAVKEDVLSDVRVITKFVDDLNLDTKLFKA